MEGGSGSRSDRSYYVLLLVILFRLINSLLCRTLFVPDEHWQSLEVAYKTVFEGYLSWEWDKGLRGYTHPLIFVCLYKVLVFLRLDYQWMMAECPRILQSILSAVSDWYLYKVASLMFSSRQTAKYTLLSIMFSWFTFYCSSRTLSNTLEASLVPLILYNWFLSINTNKTKYTSVYIIFISISVLIRPTGGLLWLPLIIHHFITITSKGKFLKHFFIICIIALLWSVVVDRIFYRRWVVVQWEFLKFNLLHGISAQYGTHPWHWYVTQGLPVVLGTGIPLLLHGIWLTFKTQPRINLIPLLLACWLTIVHSFIAHKEFRFVFPVLQLTIMYNGLSISYLLLMKNKAVKMMVYLLLLSNIPIAMYFSLIHQKGGYAVMEYLRKDVNANSSILFLMPCHSTPFYSHLHGTHNMSFLQCPPDKLDVNYVNSEKNFYKDPLGWLTYEYSHQCLPTHIVIFDILLSDIYNFLDMHSYHKMTSIFHAHLIDDDRKSVNILVYKLHSATIDTNKYCFV